jgi:ADP-dependent NAD(P)H-hydrate dehydratase
MASERATSERATSERATSERATSERATGERAAELPTPKLPRLESRRETAHKGDFGNALLIGGSRGMAGAIAMAGLSAVRVGAGLVRLAVPDRCLETVAAFSPCAMTIPLADDDAGRIALPAAEMIASRLPQATCVAMGPGLGQSRELQQLVRRVLKWVTCPAVIDADGLNNLGKDAARLIKQWSASVVVTPHPGEWMRMCGVAAGDRDAQCQAAVEFARDTKAVVVLKGHRTFITDGLSAVWNTTGTPAMATGGSGDVLTGAITALICQGLTPRDAAHLGVHIHGLAAEMAARQLGTHVVLPTELIDFLPHALAAACV